jgi:hypothetical protein
MYDILENLTSQIKIDWHLFQLDFIALPLLIKINYIFNITPPDPDGLLFITLTPLIRVDYFYNIDPPTQSCINVYNIGPLNSNLILILILMDTFANITNPGGFI